MSSGGRAEATSIWAPPLVAASLFRFAKAIFQSVRHRVVGSHAAIIAERSSSLSSGSLQGSRVAWVGKSSLAGKRSPRQLLRERGLDPDRLFERMGSREREALQRLSDL